MRLVVRLGCCLLSLVVLNACVAVGFQRMPESPPPVNSEAFANEMARLGRTAWTEHNQVRTLVNGRRYYPAMLKAMRAARHSITFESYVCVDSEPTQAFTEVFVERARAGVKVHLILDAYGCSDYGEENIRRMREAGVEVQWYSPFCWWRPLRYNHRTHRRVLVVDGRIGFTGGAGWAYCWDGDAENQHRWRDTQYELRGPVVAQLQDNFNDNWQELTGERLTGAGYYPPLRAEGRQRAQMVLGSPEKQPDTLGSCNLLAMRAARHSIVIAHAYFIPTRGMEKALLVALQRGVRVEILMPGRHLDFPASRAVATPTLRRLQAAGAELFEYQPTMTHGKLMVVDDYLSLAGSGNLDQRSFFINDENNLHVLDAAFAAEQRRMCEQDKVRCKRLERADLRRSFGRALQGFFGRWVAYQL